MRHEKHPGHDDVCLWFFDDGSERHVDQAVFRNVPAGASVRKNSFSRTLVFGDEYEAAGSVSLSYSSDFQGMCAVMPVALALMLGLACAALAHPRNQGPAAPKGKIADLH